LTVPEDTSYPLRVTGRLDAPLSRWLWLVKWLLVIPHVVVLVFLWAAFVACTIVAFFAILVTGRYPQALFHFNVGVLRWTWRVGFYSYSALGTDRYPPFTLADVQDYPARLDVAYPERLSRGLVLVKWWLLAIPQYIVISVFLGGGIYLSRQAQDRDSDWVWTGSTGLINILVLVAAIVLLFTATYPRTIFDLVLGLNRWVWRVAAYATLMTDRYPPFRLDMGGEDAPIPTPPPTPAAPVAAAATAPAPPGAPSGGLSAGRLVSIIVGAVASLVALGLIAGGGVLLWADQTQRDNDGFLLSPNDRVSTGTYAITMEDVDVSRDGPDWFYETVFDTVRVRVSSPADRPLFVGIGPEVDVDAFLAGVPHEEYRGGGASNRLRERQGDESPAQPSGKDFWVVSDESSTTATVTWDVEEGRWAGVVMNADAERGVVADVRFGAKLRWLGGAAVGILVGGAVLLVLGVAGIWWGMQRPPAPPVAAAGPEPERVRR